MPKRVGGQFRLGMVDLLGLYVLAVLLTGVPGFIADPGVGWHLRAGEWMTKNLSVIRFDPFLFAPQNKPWVDDQWLADIIFWLLYLAGGFPLLHALGLMLCLAPYFFVLAPCLQRYSKSPTAISAVLLLACTNGALQWTLRPVLFSFWFYAILYVRLLRWFDEDPPVRSVFWQLPVLFLLWANLHPAFVLGLVLLAVYGVTFFAEAFQQREARIKLLRTVILFILCAAATIINPYGWKLHLSILSLAASSFFMQLNMEWLPPTLSETAFIPFFLSVFLFFYLVVKAKGRGPGAVDWLLTLVLLFLACEHRRYIPYWIMSTIVPLLKLSAANPMCAQPLKPLRRLMKAVGTVDQTLQGSPNRLTAGALVVLCFFAAMSGHLPFQPAQYSSYGSKELESAAQVLAGENLEKVKIFNLPDDGGYLIWRFAPMLKVFIDDRNTLNGEEKYKESFRALAGSPAWADFSRKYGFNCVLIGGKSPLARELTAGTDWQRLWSGNEDGLSLFKKNES